MDEKGRPFLPFSCRQGVCECPRDPIQRDPIQEEEYREMVRQATLAKGGIFRKLQKTETQIERDSRLLIQVLNAQRKREEEQMSQRKMQAKEEKEKAREFLKLNEFLKNKKSFLNDPRFSKFEREDFLKFMEELQSSLEENCQLREMVAESNAVAKQWKQKYEQKKARQREETEREERQRKKHRAEVEEADKRSAYLLGVRQSLEKNKTEEEKADEMEDYLLEMKQLLGL